MTTFDFSPLYRTSVGFDRLASLVDSASRADSSANGYPPYNIETLSETNRIQVSEATAALLAEGFELEDRGKIAIKGKGRQHTYFLTAAKPVTAKADS